LSSSPAIDLYADVVEGQADAAMRKLVLDLASLYQGAGAPGTVRESVSAAGLETAAAKRPRPLPRRARTLRLPIKAGVLLAAAAALVIVGVVGYAVAPLVDQLLITERGADTLPMQTIGQAQTSNGVTVKVDRAYADVNRILVAYTIQVPAGYANSYSGIDGKISLADARGLAFPVIDAQGLDGSTPHLSAGLVSFDAESLAPGTGDVTLRLTFPDVRAKADDPARIDLTAGAFAFTFTVPVAPGRAVTVGTTVTAGGVPVTLERVVITRSETRAYLRFPAGAGISDGDWYAQAHISGSGWDSRQLPANLSGLMTLGAFFTNRAGEHVTTWSGNYSGRHGEWALTVDTLAGVDSAAPSTQDGQPKQARIAGPWTFRFSLP
jgi:Domain of unknown function (DUF4179)